MSTQYLPALRPSCVAWNKGASSARSARCNPSTSGKERLTRSNGDYEWAYRPVLQMFGAHMATLAKYPP